MAQWGIKDDKTSTGTVTLTAPTVTFDGATGHAAGVYTSTDHPFQLGDEVVYSNGGGTSVVGLTSASTYYVTEVTSGTFMVAATEAKALHNVPTPIVSTDGVGASHTFIRALAAGRGTIAGSSTLFTTEASTGDIIHVGSQEMVITSIASDTACTVKNNNQAPLTVFSGQAYTLNEKPSNKFGGVYSSVNILGIDGSEIAAVAGGLIGSVNVTAAGSRYISAPTVSIAAPTLHTIALEDVNTTTDTITETAHGQRTGVKLTYLKVGSTAIGGLADATAYYLIVTSPDTFQLATTLENALAGTAINLTGTGSANQTFRGTTATATASIAAGSVSSFTITNAGTGYTTAPAVNLDGGTRRTILTTMVDDTTDVITYTDHGFVVGDKLTYKPNGGSALSPLTSGLTVFVIAGSFTANTFKLSLTLGGSAIDLASTGNSAQYLDFFDTGSIGGLGTASLAGNATSASKGWVLRTAMTGAHAGRTQYETLVALSSGASMSDADDGI